ncbi:MAG: 30S ribosomal protein S9 [Candidatus Brennerbacteria bacterium]|nr:30S ribosomal protein S9 [Candidatus Brennerbacteria bacterium]
MKEIKTKETKKIERYLATVGRRKTAAARARVTVGGKGIHITVNGRELAKYFSVKKLQDAPLAPFAAASLKDAAVSVRVSGGGVRAQAEAVRLAIARALVAHDPAYRPRLKTLGFLKRDPRMVERKKPGLRKARRPQQWRKR